ncbi:HlyD family secretion protein [Kosakonia pseudosacchari]|uniref:Hemolysin secretion protein D n=1 Tax=Kosakonia pseudosacchari TaxID=1646340 RepID=A0ABX4IM06_9ENTR|nr:HlyD family secretion protein [Kosakonia pseudosacchari]PDO84971.1 hemolysin secretion protein D [Kosakonia pseudosacchari]QOV66255.1 HlyD family secretion protein [Kosakonia pseudosacchari]
MMTPEQKFARWVRVSIASFLLMFVYFIVADIWIPLTPDSTVMRVVTPVSARVSGYVAQVYVQNNSQVKKGDLLFELDATPFNNQVEAAQIALAQAKLTNQQLDAQIVAAQASLKTAQLTAQNDRVTFERYQNLSVMHNVSQADVDKVRTTWQSSVQSVNNLNASIDALNIERGDRDDARNVTLQKYRNALQQAQLNLSWTQVRAEADGAVSNLQLSPGFYAAAGTAALALVHDKTDIVADFREKSLRHTRVGTDAAVVFDALPGHVFKAHVTSSDAGVLAGQQAVNGELSAPQTSNRWVRDAQRMRIHVALDEPLPKELPTGARATVQLYNSEGVFARFFSGVQIHLVSLLHYVY